MVVQQAIWPARSVWDAEDSVVPDILVASNVDVAGVVLMGTMVCHEDQK